MRRKEREKSDNQGKQEGEGDKEGLSLGQKEKKKERKGKKRSRGYLWFPINKTYPKYPFRIGAQTILQLCFILKYLFFKFVLFSNPSFANLFYA